MREQRGGGNRIISGGVQNRFWGGVLWYVFPSPEFSPPPLFPDLPILAFFVFLAFFVLRFSLLFCAFLLSFPRISGVLQGGKSSLFSGDPRFFLPKKQGLEGQGFSLTQNTTFT